MSLHKILKIIVGVLSIVGVIFALMIMSGNESMIDNMMYVTYVVLAIILALVLVYVIKGLFAGNIKKTLMSVGAFVVILVISYAMSSGTDLDLTPFTNKGVDITEAISKNVGAGLYAFYALAIIAIGSMTLSGIKKLTNK
ncbi:hypothetical protein [Xanthomarina spongicola]|uniref:Uncharacterized protein n=1 Tax=Xanthomarina spongicola TaxID=570520 RepID=A0A316DW83_9FLAO|nr:hypothetical protein [Xanthomarina spongicola]PWK20843.1 hypothetical protein LX78_00549 [Xanthomarina spongicola]